MPPTSPRTNSANPHLAVHPDQRCVKCEPNERHAMPKRPPHPGITLIETLAALTILSAASIIVLGFLQIRAKDSTAPAAGLHAALERARLLAITGGGGVLIIGDDGSDIRFGSGRDQSPQTRRVLSLPHPWSIRLAHSGGPSSGDVSLVFDHAGRSADASLVLRRAESPRLRLRWLGIAGQLIETGAESARTGWSGP